MTGVKVMFANESNGCISRKHPFMGVTLILDISGNANKNPNHWFHQIAFPMIAWLSNCVSSQSYVLS
jgi:hypothetical protein